MADPSGDQGAHVANSKLLEELNISPVELEPRAEGLRRQGATTMYVTVDEDFAGLIAVADPIKASTPGALESLRNEGIRIVMVTGDHRESAAAVAQQLAITEIEAEVLPQRKNAIVQRLRGAGRAVAMAGDGVNDAPALAEADVGPLCAIFGRTWFSLSSTTCSEFQ